MTNKILIWTVNQEDQMKKLDNKKPKLTGIYMNKFQSIIDPTFINLEGLTFLYGPNSAGKSSIIDALILLRDITDGFPNGGMFSFIEGFENNQADSLSVSVGLEFIAGEMEELYRHNQKIKQWDDSLDDKLSSEIFDFHASIAGKKVQIEIGELGGEFKVAIDGVPLFEFIGSNDEESELFAKNGGIVGELIIHKNNQWFKVLHFSPPGSEVHNESIEINAAVDLDKIFHQRLIVRDSNDQLVVRGIEFSVDSRPHGRVSVHHTVHDALFFKYEENKIQKNLLKKEEIEFLFNNYSEDAPEFNVQRKKRRQLYYQLESFAEYMDLIIQGFFFQMSYALNYSHVPGDRKVINSNKPIGISAGGKVGKSVQTDTDFLHLSNYAKYLTHFKEDSYSAYANPAIKSDFVNLCLKSYLHSLKGYSVLSESSNIVSVGLPQKGLEDGEVFFLKVRNPKMHVLGFQDVGSGLSYIMPVLTSLWNHEFSIIEQPELHLHPKAQCEMGDVFISAYSKGSIAVVESHSEHLLLRILRRIRETTKGINNSNELKLKAENISIYYFDPIADGHTVVRKIRVDRYGELLDLWPGGFFSERDSELFT